MTRATKCWIKIHKVNSGLKSITPREAIDVVLCWGWIDGQRKGFDDRSFLQRYSPRSKKASGVRSMSATSRGSSKKEG